jgi:hypothetical protein
MERVQMRGGWEVDFYILSTWVKCRFKMLATRLQRIPNIILQEKLK